ncbi:MAG: butyrate kinase [candidate division KSB1 bacterium]|nr:butyrate kinase [candidate division KSB1 bacterium]
MKQIFVVNPGSTSTKIALFADEACRFRRTIDHPAQELARYSTIIDQLPLRFSAIEQTAAEEALDLAQVDAFVGRGGLLRPIPGGAYIVDEEMLQDLRNAVCGEHASNLGALIVDSLAKSFNKPAFIVDPVVVDELQDLARLSGHPQFQRKSIFHALNQKSVARKAARTLGKDYSKVNLIVAHLGGGISVGAHQRGRVIDVNNALDGEGAYSPERSGSLPCGDLVRYCFTSNKGLKEILSMIKGSGGLVAYLGTNDVRKVVKRLENGDRYAELIYKGMAYQTAKQIGEMAAVLKGKVDAIVITGGISNDKLIVTWIKEYVSFIAPVMVFPGEEEMQALAEGALRVLNGEEQALHYRESAKEYDHDICRAD